MAENEKDVPIKEREDGSVLAKVDLPEEIESEEESPIFEIEAPGKKEKTVKKIVPQKSIQISLFG